MARKPRENVEGGIYHVFARGNDRRPVFLDRRDRGVYLRNLGNTVARLNWIALAYCLMENHVHLLIETPDGNLSAGMQRLHGAYVQAFNSRHGRVGHVFQGRYGAVRVKSDGQLFAVASYVARNPVEAGLCSRIDEWEWSSYRAVAGLAVPPWLDTNRLLSYFDPDPAVARSRYMLECSSYESVPKGV